MIPYAFDKNNANVVHVAMADPMDMVAAPISTTDIAITTISSTREKPPLFFFSVTDILDSSLVYILSLIHI